MRLINNWFGFGLRKVNGKWFIDADTLHIIQGYVGILVLTVLFLWSVR